MRRDVRAAMKIINYCNSFVLDGPCFVFYCYQTHMERFLYSKLKEKENSKEVDA